MVVGEQRSVEKVGGVEVAHSGLHVLLVSLVLLLLLFLSVIGISLVMLVGTELLQVVEVVILDERGPVVGGELRNQVRVFQQTV